MLELGQVLVAVCCQQGRCLVDGLSVRKFTDLQHALGPSSGYPSQWPWSAKGEAPGCSTLHINTPLSHTDRYKTCTEKVNDSS